MFCTGTEFPYLPIPKNNSSSIQATFALAEQFDSSGMQSRSHLVQARSDSSQRMRLNGMAHVNEAHAHANETQVEESGSLLDELGGVEIIQVVIQRGHAGFGFTLADGKDGKQRVRQVLDPDNPQLASLRKRDQLLQIDDVPIANLQHSQVHLF